MEGFQGALQTDGYAAYNKFENREGISLLACMAHARRKFDKAKDNDPKRAGYALKKIQELYEVESIAREEELSNIKRQLANESFVLLATLSDRRIDKLEREAEAGIISEEKLAQEKKKINRQTAFIDKAQALFNIGINTAVAITKALATNPFLVPFVVALGLAQAATVIATPIPQFKKGTKSSPSGAAWIGEEGPELMIHNGHVGLSPGVATLANLKHGTEIVPADITNQILKYTAVANGFEGKAKDSDILMMMSELKGIKQAIKNKPVASSTTTAAGILTSVHKGNTTIKKIEKFFK